MNTGRWVGLVAVAAMGLTACPDDGGRPLGAACDDDTQCESGLCMGGVCLDPNGDEDQDGLTNAIERALGTDAFVADTDGDGVSDGVEVGDVNAPNDSDGDFVPGTNTLHDALEPNHLDRDGDCVNDQFDDADDDVAAAQIAVVCRTDGVCGADGATLAATCEPGTPVVWTCVYDGVPGYDAGPDATCDGADSDCDGEADEDYAPVGTTCGAGACTGSGVTSCEGGVVIDSCTEDPAEHDRTCDGVDDDCDGETDEDWVDTTTTCGEGACVANGTLTCGAGGAVDSCTPGAGAASDASCNGIDDDCDGETDEDYAPQATACGTGACAGVGTTSCVAGEEQDSCLAGTAAASDASCDDVDDDCDGTTDEDYVSVGTACGMGACAGSGVTSCVGGEVVDSCAEGGGEAQDADCDDVDDDCDGETDEDYVAAATSCGQGACVRAGVTSCADGVVSDSCVPGTAAADDATCDGVDDDCNGQTDEGYVTSATSCGVGACAATGTLSCVDGAPSDSCVAGQGAADDTTCNDVDDDCNGQTDDGYVSMTTACGVGACAAAGATSCSEGDEGDSCVPLEPNCGGAVCGSDGCGGSCGTCTPIAAPCATAVCVEGGCDVEVAANTCFIDGACYDDGKGNPTNSCQACRASNPRAWTALGSGVACASDGESCTTDTCDGNGTCQHLPLPDLVACDDGDTETLADTCGGGRCGGFLERIEPQVGQFPDQFSLGGEGRAGFGAHALAYINSLTAGSSLWVTSYTTALQGVSQSLGFASLGDYTVQGSIAINGDSLFELVDGQWTSAQDSGSLRAAWPSGQPPSEAPVFTRVARYQPALSLANLVYGVGTNASGQSGAVRRCSRATFCLPGQPCGWSCGTSTLGANFPANVTFFDGEALIGTNTGSAFSPTTLRVLEFSDGQQAWLPISALTLSAGGRVLSDFKAVGGGAFTTSPPAWLVGAGSGNLLYVGDLSQLKSIAITGALPNTRYSDITVFRGNVVVLWSQLAGDSITYGIAWAPLDDALDDSASWQTRTIFSPFASRRARAIAADAEHLFLFGQGRDATSNSNRRAMWRFSFPPAVAPTFVEDFDGTSLPSGWEVVDQGVATTGPAWEVADGVLQETSNTHDVDGADTVIEKRGTFFWNPSVSFPSGTFSANARAADNDGWGLMWGIQDEHTYYRVGLDHQRSFIRVVRSDGPDTMVTMAENLDYTPPRHLWHRLTVERTGDTHVIKVGRATVLTFEDGSYGDGGVGVYAWGMSGVYFDDVTVTAP